MSRENVEVARRLWGQFVQDATGDRPARGIDDAAVHPDVEYVEDDRWPGSGRYRGIEAIRARFDEYLEILGPVEMTVLEVIDAGDRVVSIFRTRGESSATGVPFDQEWAYVWTFRDGRVVRWRAYFDKAEAFEAIERGVGPTS